MERLADFFVENVPPWPWILIGGPLGLAWSLGWLTLAGRLKTRHGVRTGYTRKLFHFVTFFTAAALLGWRGTPAVCLFGGMASLVILAALLLGDGHPLYEALAREKDAPRRTHYVVVPYLATLLGGIATATWLERTAGIGFLVTGLGDAVGEPVGTRWGRHRYRVPSLRAVKATRSLEGSAAVVLVSALAVALGLARAGLGPDGAADVLRILAVACACGLVEAVSPHGWDNLTMQVVPAYLSAELWVG